MQMYDLPDARGHFGPYGGIYVAETLMTALDELRQQYEIACGDADFCIKNEKIFRSSDFRNPGCLSHHV